MSSVISDDCLNSDLGLRKLNEEEAKAMLKISTYPLGPIQTNCYVIQDEENNCIVIDPGEEGARIITEIENMGLSPLAILLTHGHFDHIGAVDAVRDRFEIPVYIHENESKSLTDPVENGSTRYPGLPLVKNRKADYLITGEGDMKIGPFVFEVRHTPGHSAGSLSFIFQKGKIAIVGDTLFKDGVGRTDLPGGDTQTLLDSIHNKLLILGEGFTIYPGHGGPTTPQSEMDSNPYLKGF